MAHVLKHPSEEKQDLITVMMGPETSGRDRSPSASTSSYSSSGDDGPPSMLLNSIPPVDLSEFKAPPGYDSLSQTTHDTTSVAPPPQDPQFGGGHRESLPQTAIRVEPLTEPRVRSALKKYVERHCCYGRAPVDKAKITKMQNAFVYHFKLETYTEQRSTGWMTHPYRGEKIDGPSCGLAPLPWQVVIPTAPASDSFTARHAKCDVPHTAYVLPCARCRHTGLTGCPDCYKLGRASCHCMDKRTHDLSHNTHKYNANNRRGRRRRNAEEKGNGNESPELAPRDRRHQMASHYCGTCNGTGWRACTNCSGHGMLTCTTCDGRRDMYLAIRLNVEWKTYTTEQVIDPEPSANLPLEVIRNATGRLIFSHTDERVTPISHKNMEMKPLERASMQALLNHERDYAKDQRILQQRQTVQLVPVTVVTATHNDKEKTFYVYGTDDEVYFDDYWQTCCGRCCCCTIL